MVLPIGPAQPVAADGVSTNPVWVYLGTLDGTAPMQVLDLDSGRTVASFLLRPGTPSNGRGAAFDPSDGNIWDSVLLQTSAFGGDGLIHKNPAFVGGPDIMTLLDPFSAGRAGPPGVGGLEYDPDDGTLWAASYRPSTDPVPQSKFVKLDPASGAALTSCSIPYTGTAPSGGNRSVVVSRSVGGLVGRKLLLTTASDILPSGTKLYAIDVHSCLVAKTYSLPIDNVTGMDLNPLTGDLIAASITDTGTALYNLGPAPYRSATKLLDVPGVAVEDIALANPRVLGSIICVKLDGSGDFTARFRWRNPNTVDESLPVGPLNYFTPDPKDRGQPTAFAAHRSGTFSVTVSNWDGSPLTWVIDGRPSTASSSSPTCSS